MKDEGRSSTDVKPNPASSRELSPAELQTDFTAVPVPQAAPLNKVRFTVMVALMFSLLVSGIFRTPPIVFMAAILCAAPLAALALGKLSSRRLRVERTMPAVGKVGDVLHGNIVIENQSRWPALITQVRAGQITQPLYGPGGRRSWPVIADGEGVHEIPVLRPYESVELPQTWRLRRRGIYQMPPARAGSIDPLGFTSDLSAKSTLHELVVLPRTIRLERLGFVGGTAARMQAPQHATVVADAMDFHGVRPWQPGEAIRRIHWKSTARTGQLQIVEWEENVARDLAILLDTQAATMAGGESENTLETTVTIAASVAQHLLEGGYACQIFFWQPNDSGFELTKMAARNAGDLSAALRLLAGVRPVESDEATLPELARAARGDLPARRAVLLVASSLANIDGARRLLDGRADRGGHCYTLLLDAAHFWKNSESKKTTLAPVPLHTSLDPLTRVVRSGDSLAAALEQMA